MKTIQILWLGINFSDYAKFQITFHALEKNKTTWA